MLEIRTEGLAPDSVDYRAAWAVQRETHRDVVAGVRPPTLLLLEHSPVYTAGARTEAHERPDDGTPVIDVDRGGKITWHGPGQLVGYPIVPLASPVDVVAHVRLLEGILIDVIAALGIVSRRVGGRSGVWVDGASGEAKVAAIGVRVERGVTMHGFALNCDNDLEPFRHIVPCGIPDADVTTLSAVARRPIPVATALPVVADAFARAFATEVAA
ncbi:lipoyl(octanoyl) transferase LipB [Microbacterium dauci]|uniref:Octanoyltransferase n=1 Tax=Microbacterium dauci TaxID=3048008 RepID=A0ABT6ZBU8_9MICO|nr:lipoyl(octanoyl) transferase LipB [Microbacterium sp. LX3-4]MDJ1113628.1 lipoyl(octanoyl) transferase LipB [Microbacterium sp. LX3-4]